MLAGNCHCTVWRSLPANWAHSMETYSGVSSGSTYGHNLQGKKNKNKLLMYSSLTNISIAESLYVSISMHKMWARGCQQIMSNHGHLFLDFRSWSSHTHPSNNVQLCSARLTSLLVHLVHGAGQTGWENSSPPQCFCQPVLQTTASWSHTKPHTNGPN